MSSWQAMAVAPRDGSRILGWFGDRCIAVFWRSGPEYVRGRATGKKVCYWPDGYSRYREPDCWRPQPAGPDPAQFPDREPPAHPQSAPPTKSPAARTRELVRARQAASAPAARQVAVVDQKPWCSQCDRLVSWSEACDCASPFCRLRRGITK